VSLFAAWRSAAKDVDPALTSFYNSSIKVSAIENERKL